MPYIWLYVGGVQARVVRSDHSIPHLYSHSHAFHFCGAIPCFWTSTKTLLAEPYRRSNLFGHNDRTKCRRMLKQRYRCRFAACLPLHTFGHPAGLIELVANL
jgi:hypothetical protein